MDRQKTIFILASRGLIGRNILGTNFLSILKEESGLRVVILTPKPKKDFYTKEFGAKNIIVEGLAPLPIDRKEIFFRFSFLNLSNTKVRKIQRLVQLKRNKNNFSYYHYTYSIFLAVFISRIYLFRKLFRWLDFKLSLKNTYQKYFDIYGPDLVFSTDIFEPEDIEMMRLAKYNSIPSVGMVRSWDNIPSKGLNRIIPDKLIVNTPKIKEEAVKYNDTKPENITVVGIPHYDRYIKDKRTPREEFFKDLNLDPKKKTIFFAPPSSTYTQGDPVSITQQVVDTLKKLDAQIIIRLYITGKIDLGNVQAISDLIAIDDPSESDLGPVENFMRTDLVAGDSHLADLFYYSDVIIAFASTLVIDAMVFDKPVVFIDFDGTPGRPYWQSLRRFNDYDHQKSLLDTGGIKRAKNLQELLQYVSQYLDNPSLNKEERKMVIRERIWKMDGESSQRLAGAVLDMLKN